MASDVVIILNRAYGELGGLKNTKIEKYNIYCVLTLYDQHMHSSGPQSRRRSNYLWLKKMLSKTASHSTELLLTCFCRCVERISRIL